MSIINMFLDFLRSGVFLSFILLAGLFVLLWYKRLPSVENIVALCNALNTRGGNILLLSTMVLVFTSWSVKYIYFIVGLEVAGKLTKESALAMNGFTFLTGGVTGLAIGAWLKALSPQDMETPVGPDNQQKQTSITTTTNPAPQPVVVVPAQP